MRKGKLERRNVAVRGRKSEVRSRKAEGGLQVTINFAPMAEAKEVNYILADIHCVNDPVITHSQPAAVRSF
jgi:hypothetical protein